MSGQEWTVLQSVALASLLAWASGVRLYLVVCAVGLAGYMGYMDLPAGLKVLEHPWVIAGRRVHAGDGVLRRQDPRHRQRVGCDPYLHPHPGRGVARGRRDGRHR
jgi:hypothetical protein